ncbi:putative integral membrane protein [Cryptosporidium felis]|nr:putative integral membrane protein [Cryptosporidium felis]
MQSKTARKTLLLLLSLVAVIAHTNGEKPNSRFTGWVSEGLFTTVNNETALSECRMLFASGIDHKEVLKVSFHCKENEFLSYFGANSRALEQSNVNYIDEVQNLRLGCSNGYSFISFGGSRVAHYNNTSNGFPIIVSSLTGAFAPGTLSKPPSFVLLEGFFSQVHSFSVRRRVSSVESSNSKTWSGERFVGGCFALLPISQPGNIVYSIAGIGFIPRGPPPSNLNYSSKGIQLKNMLFKVGTVFPECQTLKGPENDHVKSKSTTVYYSMMCPNGYFNKYRTYKKYSFGTTSLASIEFECRDYGIKVENSIHNSVVRLGEHKGGPWIKHERVGNLTSMYVAYFNSTSSESCKGSNTCNPIALRYYDKEGKEFSTFINTQFGVKRSLKRKSAIRERLWVGDNPNLICVGINKAGQITSLGMGYRGMAEPTPLFIDAVKMVKPEIIAYPLSLQRNQTINTAISYNPDDVQISFLSSKATGCNYSYSPGKEVSTRSTIQVHAQCKFDISGTPQYIDKLTLFVDSSTQELKRIAGNCSNDQKNSRKGTKHLGPESAEKEIRREDQSRMLKEDQTKIISMFDHDKWPVNKWAPSPFRVQHASPYRHSEFDKDGELYQNSLDLSFAFGQSVSNSIEVVSSLQSPFNSIYLGYNAEGPNPVMLTTRLSELDSRKKTLLMHYSNFLAPSTITYWEIPSVDGEVIFTDSICVELEQRDGNIIGIGFEGSMSSVPYETLDENVSIIKSVMETEGEVIKGGLEIMGKGNTTAEVVNKIDTNKCPKMAYNTPLLEYLMENGVKKGEEEKKSGSSSESNTKPESEAKSGSESDESEIAVPFTVTCPECMEIEFIKAHYIIDGPIIGLEWKCTGRNNVETMFIGGRSPSQLTTQIFNKVQPKMIEVAFAATKNKGKGKSKSGLDDTKMPGPAFISIDGYVGSGNIQQLMYYRMKDWPLGTTTTWESNEKLKPERHVLRSVCGSLSDSQGILSLGFGFDYLPLNCSQEDIKPNLIPIDNQYSGNVPSVIINGPRILQRADSTHPSCSPFQGGSARTRLSNWIISFSCLDDEMKEEVPFSKLTVLRSLSGPRGLSGPVRVLNFGCPDEKTSVSVGENDSEVSQLITQNFELSKAGSSLIIDFSPLNVAPSQVKLAPPYSSESTTTKSTTLTNVSGFNEISTSSDSIYGVCFELTSDGKIAGIAFANKPHKKKKASSGLAKKLNKIFS